MHKHSSLSFSLIARLRSPAGLTMAALFTLALGALSVRADDKAASKSTAMDPAARPVVQALYDAMGGDAGFSKVGALEFSFGASQHDSVRVYRTHWWNRSTNDYRVQAARRDGKKMLVLFNLDTKQGRAWLDGQPQTGDALKKALDGGYAWFINDTYWLLMPAKLFDPGVHVAMDGQATVNGAPCDRLKVTFDQVGLTPGDTYWAYVDRNTHLMDRWGMVLQGDRAKGDTTEVQYDWTGWKSVGPIRLAEKKPAVGDSTGGAIVFPLLVAADKFPAAVFADTTFLKP